MNYLITIFLVVVAIFATALITKMHFKKRNPRNVGVLKIIHEDGEAPYIFLELNESPNVLENASTVSLTVSHEKPSL